jgi:hypothetical protein
VQKFYCTGVLETGGTAESRKRLGVHLSRNIKRKERIVCMPTIGNVFDPVFIKIALTVLIVTEIRHTV